LKPEGNRWRRICVLLALPVAVPNIAWGVYSILNNEILSDIFGIPSFADGFNTNDITTGFSRILPVVSCAVVCFAAVELSGWKRWMYIPYAVIMSIVTTVMIHDYFYYRNMWL
jgi:hypothetical protein